MSIQIVNVALSYGGTIALPLFIWTIVTFALMVTLTCLSFKRPGVFSKIRKCLLLFLTIAPPWALHCLVIYYTGLQLFSFKYLWGREAHPVAGELMRNFSLLFHGTLQLALASTFCLLVSSFIVVAHFRPTESVTVPPE